MPEQPSPRPRREPPVPVRSDDGGGDGWGYAELDVTTNFSFLQGGSHPDELVYRAAELGYRAVAVTDVNTMAGVVRAWEAAKRAQMRLLIGTRLRFRDGTPDLLVWCADRRGYAGLCKLLTRGKRRAPKGECWLEVGDVLEMGAAVGEGWWVGVAWEATEGMREATERRSDEATERGERRSDGATERGERRSDGATKWRRGEATERRSDGGVRATKRDEGWGWLGGLREVFGRRLSLLMWPGYGYDDRARWAALARVSRRYGVPLLACNHVRYHDPSRRPLLDVLTCVREKCTVHEAGYRLLPNAERYLKDPARMHRTFAAFPRALMRTLEVAEACRFSLDELRYEYPDEISPPGMTRTAYLRQLTEAGARERYPVEAGGVPEKVRKQIEHELALIEQLRIEPYFLTVYDIVKFARSRGILCQGRGSAANSAVCYCLGITAVDPARIDLLFERFVSAARDEPPDIDVDFEHERREEVIQYVYAKYGRERCAMTAEVHTYRGRSAVRDVGKALGLGLDAVDALAKRLDGWHGGVLSEAQIREAGLDPADTTVRNLVVLTEQLLGFPRHLSQHVGGLVMTRTPLEEMCPIENASMPGRTVLEWDKDDIDAVGMLKVDCLGLGMLTALSKALALVNGAGRLSGSSDEATKRRSDGATEGSSDEATERRSDGGEQRRSDEATKRRSDGATQGSSDEATERRSDGGEQRRSDEATERRSDGGDGNSDAGGQGGQDLSRSGGLAEGDDPCTVRLRGNNNDAGCREVRADHADAAFGSLHTVEYRRGTRTSEQGGLSSVSSIGSRVSCRVVNTGGTGESDRHVEVSGCLDGATGRGGPCSAGPDPQCRTAGRSTIVESDPVSSPLCRCVAASLPPPSLCRCVAASLPPPSLCRFVAPSLRRSSFPPLQLHTIPPEDPAVYDMICRADTVGVFQIESRAQMSMLPRLRPRCFYDLVIEVAIVRPGPIQGNMVHPYLRRRNGEEPVTFPSKELEAVLGKTLGVPLFQEQAMKVAMVAAGFSAEEADRLRRSMAAWRYNGAIETFRQRIVEGMVANGYDRAFAEQTFEQIRGFGEYGFPESHAASFALLVYASCWLKRYHPAAFCAALLNSQPMGFYAPAQLVRDAREHGVEVRGVDVNASGWESGLEGGKRRSDGATERRSDEGAKRRSDEGAKRRSDEGAKRRSDEATKGHGDEGCRFVASLPPPSTWGVGGPAVRLGFHMVKGMQRAWAEAIVAEREARGAFASVDEFHRRTGLPRAAVLLLAESDAFASLGMPRRHATWDALAAHGGMMLQGGSDEATQRRSDEGGRCSDEATERRSDEGGRCSDEATEGHSDEGGRCSDEATQRRSDEGGRCSDGATQRRSDGGGQGEAAAKRMLPEMPLGQEVLLDYATTGLSLKAHPVGLVREALTREGVLPARVATSRRNGSRVKVCGLVLVRQRPGTASGIVFMTLEDETGVVNLIIRPPVWAKYRPAARHAGLLLAHGVVETHSNVTHVLVTKLEDRSPLLAGYRLTSRDFH